MKTINYRKYLSIMLWLVALHSLCVGLGLIIIPGSFMESLGYGSCSERFFRTQGGVFHIAMAVGYAMAAYNSRRFECLVLFSIVVKFIATLFLFLYFVFVSQILILLGSMVSDFLMGLVIWMLYKFAKTDSGKE